MEKTDIEKADDFKQQGNEFFKKKEYSKAIDSYSRAISLNPIEPSYYGNRAACYLGLFKYEDCIRDCKETLNIDSNFVKAYMRLGRSNLYLGKFNEAREAFKKYLELDPKDTSIKDELNSLELVERLYTEAKVAGSQEKLTDALSDVKQVLKICPSLVPAKILYIEVLAKKNLTKEAIEKSSEYLSELSHNLDYLYARGLALYYDGQTLSENAKKTWKHLLQMDPDDQRCKEAIKRMNRQEEAKEKGNAAFKEYDYQTAEKFYTEGINQDPKNKNLVAQLYLNRSTAKLKMKKPKEALEDCNSAIKLNENYAKHLKAKAYLRRGEIRMEIEEFEEAKQDFNQAHQMDPSLGAKNKIKEAEKAAKMAARKDYYKILEIEKTAGDDEIRKAYKKMALKWHPDKNNGDPEAEKRFKDINEAYSILSDPQKKQRYDSGADLEEMNGFDGGVDPNVIFRSFFGGGGGDFGGFGGGGRGGFGGGGFSFSFS